ncbi:hypothetical protein FOXYSP1_17744 [Fusarium oxysporum f. sp. phaseoli]
MCQSLPPYPTERAAVAAACQASRFLSLRQGLHQNRKRQWIEVVFSFPQELQKLSKTAGNAEGFGSPAPLHHSIYPLTLCLLMVKEVGATHGHGNTRAELYCSNHYEATKGDRYRKLLDSNLD